MHDSSFDTLVHTMVAYLKEKKDNSNVVTGVN
jgi:hypothetical protein